MEKERIILGSGKLFHTEFTGKIPSDEEIEKDDNLVGLIKGGATVEYKPEFYTAEDDLGLVSKDILTKEDALIKSGVMTLNGNKLAALTPTARVSTSEDGKRRVVRIGGVTNNNGKKYVIRFLHEDKEDGNIRLTIVGRNEAGWSLAFAKDKETVVDAEFKAKPHDKEGTLIIYDEEIKVSEATATTDETEATAEA